MAALFPRISEPNSIAWNKFIIGYIPGTFKEVPMDNKAKKNLAEEIEKIARSIISFSDALEAIETALLYSDERQDINVPKAAAASLCILSSAIEGYGESLYDIFDDLQGEV